MFRNLSTYTKQADAWGYQTEYKDPVTNIRTSRPAFPILPETFPTLIYTVWEWLGPRQGRYLTFYGILRSAGHKSSELAHLISAAVIVNPVVISRATI
jgi:hypothetical protein